MVALVAELRKQQKPKMLPCVHLGEPTGETVQCKTCKGKVSIKLLACAVFGKCTMVKKVGVACCAGCGEYTPPG